MKILFTIVMALGLAGAARAAETHPLGADDLAGRRYVLIVANGAAARFDRAPTLEFGRDLAVAGQICNRYRGQGELLDNRLTVRQAVSTRMLCLHEGLSQLEEAFLGLLAAGADIAVSGDVLTLSGSDLWLVFREVADTAAADGAAVPARPAQGALPAGLAGSEFILQSVDGVRFAFERRPRIEFAADMAVSGVVCNSFRGPGILVNGVYTSQVASTMMACPDPALNQLEARIHQLLRDGAALRLEGDTLTLWNAGVTLVFKRAGAVEGA